MGRKDDSMMKRWFDLFERLVLAVERLARVRCDFADQQYRELLVLKSELREHVNAKRHSNTPKRQKLTEQPTL